MTSLIGVYGGSGFGREVLPLVRSAYNADRIVFIDDALADDFLNGVKVLDWSTFVSIPAERKRVTLAIADSHVRERLAIKCKDAGVGVIDVRAPDLRVLGDVVIGEGAILCDRVTITSNVRIGKGFHGNIYSYVAHDCIIGDYVTFAPRVSCNGNVHIEDHAYIGTGAVIRQGTPEKPLVIGRGAVVGMGAVVTKDVPAGSTVVGNPARPLVKR